MASSSITGSLLAQAQSGLMQAQQTKLMTQAQGAGKDDGRIEKSAKEFEAMLLSNWLQQAEQSMASVPGADEDDDDTLGKNQMMSMGVQSLATSMVASGGIGIASMIAKALHSTADKAHEATASAATKAPKNIEK
jgi:Rod binding domain-containing protein